MATERGIRILQEKQLEAERKRNQFLKGLVSPAEETNKLLQHWVKVVGERIHGTAEKLMGQLRRVAPQDRSGILGARRPRSCQLVLALAGVSFRDKRFVRRFPVAVVRCDVFLDLRFVRLEYRPQLVSVLHIQCFFARCV